jgi:hypothetical protein
MGPAYLLTFDLGNGVAAGFGSSTASVSINNGAATWFTHFINADPSGFEWESQSMIRVADAASAQITILGVANGRMSNNAGILLDNVVFAVPSPNPTPCCWPDWVWWDSLRASVSAERGGRRKNGGMHAANFYWMYVRAAQCRLWSSFSARVAT